MTEKDHLLAIIDHLTHSLKRPICSADLRHYFAARPEERTRHLQAWGQVLLKISRLGRRAEASLHCIGRIGNRNYYARKDTIHLRLALEQERRRIRVREVLEWRLSDHVSYLIGTEFEEEGRIAAAGFVREFAGREEPELVHELAAVSRWAVDEFDPLAPSDLISRRDAVAILRAAATAYHGSEARAAQVHTNKLLALWRWPQSSLYPAVPGLQYSARQIRLLASHHFEDCDPARLACSRYGCGPSVGGIPGVIRKELRTERVA